eukprot:TCONS_00014940-protein
MRMKFMRSFFGCCELRTAVVIISIFDIIFGFYEIIDFSIRTYLELHYHFDEQKKTITNNVNSTSSNITSSFNISMESPHDELYTDSAFAIIVIGCIDLFISSFLLYVSLLRKYELRVVVFVAAIWGFVMAFLNLISFGITLSLGEYAEMALFLFVGLLESFFGYVILSFFHFMTVIVERGLDEVNMAYFAEDDTVITTIPSEIQMDDTGDDRLVMDDLNEDYPEFGDDGHIPLHIVG